MKITATNILEAKAVQTKLHELGYKWVDGSSLLNWHPWDDSSNFRSYPIYYNLSTNKCTIWNHGEGDISATEWLLNFEEITLEEKLREIVKKHKHTSCFDTLRLLKDICELIQPKRSIINRLKAGESATYRGMKIEAILETEPITLDCEDEEGEPCQVICTEKSIEKNVKFV